MNHFEKLRFIAWRWQNENHYGCHFPTKKEKKLKLCEARMLETFRGCFCRCCCWWCALLISLALKSSLAWRWVAFSSVTPYSPFFVISSLWYSHSYPISIYQPASIHRTGMPPVCTISKLFLSLFSFLCRILNKIWEWFDTKITHHREFAATMPMLFLGQPHRNHASLFVSFILRSFTCQKSVVDWRNRNSVQFA